MITVLFNLIALVPNAFPQKLGEKKSKKKILPSICDPMKRYPVEEIFNS